MDTSVVGSIRINNSVSSDYVASTKLLANWRLDSKSVSDHCILPCGQNIVDQLYSIHPTYLVKIVTTQTFKGRTLYPGYEF